MFFHLSSAVFLAKPETHLEKPARVVQSLLLKQAYTVAKSSATQDATQAFCARGSSRVLSSTLAFFSLNTIHVSQYGVYNLRYASAHPNNLLNRNSPTRSGPIRFQIREILWYHNNTFISTLKAMSP